MRRLFTQAKNLLLDILFPRICFSCRRLTLNNQVLCSDCLSSLIINSALLCPTCHARQPNPSYRCHPQESFFLGSATNYNSPAIKKMVHLFKFNSYEIISDFFANLLFAYLKKLNFNYQDFILTSIPLSSSRKRQRGFNQSELIARRLSQKINLPYIETLQRTRDTKPQSTLPLLVRAQNLKNCFSVLNPELIKNKNIILIDDVFTSGTTIRTAIEELRLHRPQKILALVVAST